ncbi:PD-(D/E)XK nuclease family protein [Neobacillus citreus]|uniref:PD-(D/E)XK nuclease family protein n=2 Tax=Neobacillus citreus TaxID=2833578 RepID=A0A9J6MPH9_9BACI|nr:PD-(D/E)XK nuclease family protein [Neobacillus citreus]MCH6265084.1 PD-(D/E)XK nuclease family protein [Neobacillus citreus]
MYKNQQPSWSLSKHRMLMECELKWVLNYYVAKWGETNSKSITLQLAWRLKHLKNMYMLFGELMHQIIESEIKTLLETGEVLSEAKIKKLLRDMLNRNYSQTKYGLNLWYKEPRVNPMIFEIYYGGNLDKTLIQIIAKKIDECVSGFIQSKTINEVIAKRNVKIVEAEKYKSFYLDGVRVVLSADLVYLDQNNDIYGIVDWKSGKRSKDDSLQLTTYALYLEKTYGADLSDIELSNEYLEEGINKNYTVDTYDFENLKSIIQASSKRMTELEENLRYPDDKILSTFQKTENERVCEWCNFKAICSDELRNTHMNNFLKDKGRKH